jgi:hypothetical protein
MSPRSLWRLLVVTMIVTSCARTPYTNRSQLILVSPGEESKLGAQA